MHGIRKDFFEDFLLNKLNGYYLILHGNNHYFLAELVFLLGKTTIYFLTAARLISPRIYPSYSHENKITTFPISQTQTVDSEKVREKAYFLWIEKGYPENNDLDNWLEAEEQLYY
jgi:hypothetical protein